MPADAVALYLVVVGFALVGLSVMSTAVGLSLLVLSGVVVLHGSSSHFSMVRLAVEVRLKAERV
jgi:hypothetical protein